MYTFTMVGCTLFKFCHFKCAKAYLLEILGMSRLWHDLMAHGHITSFVGRNERNKVCVRDGGGAKGKRSTEFYE